MDSIEHRYRQVCDRLRNAEQAFGQKPDSVCLVAVSKTRSSDEIQRIAKFDQTHFGENQVQEALTKIRALADLQCTWHFIGTVQANKCRDIASNFDWVHSVDRPKIAKRLSDFRPDFAPPLNVFLQVNLQNESSKSGVLPDQLISLAETVLTLPRLKLRGLMAIPKQRRDFNEQRHIFERIRSLRDSIQHTLNTPLDCLSMGMTNDFEAAVAEGATHVRIGTAVFGKRKNQF